MNVRVCVHMHVTMGFILCVCVSLCRDQAQVLKEDREKLLLLQPMQPWFTQEQKEELADVHSWIHRHTVPEEINTQVGISQPRLGIMLKYIKAKHRLQIWKKIKTNYSSVVLFVMRNSSRLLRTYQTHQFIGGKGNMEKNTIYTFFLIDNSTL